MEEETPTHCDKCEARRLEFYESFYAMQDDIKPIERNVNGRFKYADLKDIIGIMRPILKSHGFFISNKLGVLDSETTTITIELKHKNGYKETSEAVLKNRNTRIGENENQDLGSAITYLSRYLYVALLSIPLTNDDTDGAASKNGPGLISEPQYKLLKSLIGKSSIPAAEMEKHIVTKYNVKSLDVLTIKQASEVIGKLKS